MIGNIIMMWKALSSGWQLKQSGFWNKLGAIAALIGPSLFFLSKWAASKGWIPAEITSDEVDQITYWAMQGTGILTAYWMRATNINQGWQQRSQRQILRDLQTLPQAGYGDAGYAEYRPGYAMPSVVSGGGGGVLYRMRQLQGQPPPDHLPGDDPTIDSFNR